MPRRCAPRRRRCAAEPGDRTRSAALRFSSLVVSSTTTAIVQQKGKFPIEVSRSWPMYSLFERSVTTLAHVGNLSDVHIARASTTSSTTLCSNSSYDRNAYNVVRLILNKQDARPDTDAPTKSLHPLGRLLLRTWTRARKSSSSRTPPAVSTRLPPGLRGRGETLHPAQGVMAVRVRLRRSSAHGTDLPARGDAFRP